MGDPQNGWFRGTPSLGNLWCSTLPISKSHALPIFGEHKSSKSGAQDAPIYHSKMGSSTCWSLHPICKKWDCLKIAQVWWFNHHCSYQGCWFSLLALSLIFLIFPPRSENLEQSYAQNCSAWHQTQARRWNICVNPRLNHGFWGGVSGGMGLFTWLPSKSIIAMGNVAIFHR